MRSIFLKIFLSFWLTQAIIVGLTILTSEPPPERVVLRWRSLMADALKLYDETAISYVEQGKQEQATAYLERAQKAADMQLFWFDSQGRQLFGPSFKRAERLASLAKQTGQVQFLSEPRATLAAQVATGSGGEKYVLVSYTLHGHGPLAFRRSTRENLWHLFLAIFASGLVSFLLARYLTGPIVRLRAATQQLARGNLKARAAETRRKDEIAELVHDFNRMAQRLETLIGSQKQLISDISHELRSPLARLNVALGLARQRAGEETTNALNRIELEAERLNQMIGQLLTLARLEAGEPPEPSMVSLSDLLSSVVGDANFEARSRNCKVNILQLEDCTVMGNGNLLRSAFENVVRNAVRYTAEATDIEVRLTCQNEDSGHFALVTVRDHGPGVPSDEIPNLFRPFYRLDIARGRQTGGAGLGLAIAERAVRLHGGTITAANAPGGGLFVQIRMPATPVLAGVEA